MKLLDNARKGDVVIVWKLDRLARSLRQLIDATVLLNERGVELPSLTENINTTTRSAKLTFHVFAALGERFRPAADAAAPTGGFETGVDPLAQDVPSELGQEADLKKARALLRSGALFRQSVSMVKERSAV